MKKYYAFLAILIFLSSAFSSFAQSSPERENAGYRKENTQSRAVGSHVQKKIKAPVKMMKEADFVLYSFPGKGSNYISVNDAQPNSAIKVVAYDVSGKLIFMKELLSNPYGQLVVNIDPMISYKTGYAFVAALYNNQAYYETMLLNK